MATKISVGLGSTEESNEFLRSLWATLRATFPGIAWQYIPRRFGARRFIRLGFASIPDQDQIELGITYKNRGVIDAVVFDKHPLAPHPLPHSLKQTLKECASNAKSNIGNRKWSHFKITVNFSCDRDIALYETGHFRIEPIKQSWARLILNVNAYDTQDARFILRCKLGGVLDLLAGWTNSSWIEDELKDVPQNGFTIKPNTLWAESDWLDDIPLTDGHLCLSPDQVECINKFAGDRISYDDNLMQAAHHFHKAVRLVRYGRAEDYDLAIALFMAALEVVSLDRRQKQHCKACGQVIHGISQRIVEMANDTIGPGLDQFFKSYYTHRSKYLHEGMLQNPWPWGAPVVDVSAEHHIGLPGGSPHNLLEFTGYVLRRVCASRSRAEAATAPTLGGSLVGATKKGAEGGWRGWLRRHLGTR